MRREMDPEKLHAATQSLQSILELKKRLLGTDEALSVEQLLDLYKTVYVWVRLPTNIPGSHPDHQFPTIEGNRRQFNLELIRALLGPPSFGSQRIMEELMENNSRSEDGS